MTAARSLGLGIVGCGGAAMAVAAACAAARGISVVAAHDRIPELAEDLARASSARAYPQLDDLLAAEDVQAVYVAVPHDRLEPIAMAALLADRHVLVEKPMALSLAAIDALAAVARERRRTLGVFYELRLAPASLVARHLVRAGAIGRVGTIRISTLIDKRDDYWQAGLQGRWVSPWRGQLARAGGGVVLMNSSHQLDLVASITGLTVRRAFGFVATTHPGIDVEDSATAVLEYSNRAIASLTAGAHVPGASNGERVEIDGSLGQVVVDPYRGYLGLFLRRPFHDLPAGRWLEPATGTGDPFVAALEAFARATRRSSSPPTGAPEARAVLATVMGIYRSAAEGRPIEIDQP